MVETVAKTAPETSFISAFAEFEQQMNGQYSPYIKSLRKKAFENFKKLGFPTKKNEAWKYTSLKPLWKQEYKSSFGKEFKDLPVSAFNNYLKDSAACTLVFINGRFSESLSDLQVKNEKVTVMPLSKAFKERTELVEQYLGRWADVKNDATSALNTAFASEGAFIHVPANVNIEQPIQLIYLSDGRDDSYFCAPRNLFLIETGASVRIAEDHQAIGDHPVLSNFVNEMLVEANCNVEYYRMQTHLGNHNHISNTYIHQAKDSMIRTNVTTFEGGIVRNGLFANVNGENCDSHYEGAYVLNGYTHLDNHTFVEHSKPNSQSYQLYKGVLKGHSVGVFDGEIYVHNAAQKTNAFQLNQNVLMDDTATAHAKPQLEIFADDVKCSHGATTGTIDEEAVFYLRARGIPEEYARAMMMYAFVNEVIERISIPELREAMGEELSNKLTR